MITFDTGALIAIERREPTSATSRESGTSRFPPS
jgi:hypothetical protein